MWRNAHGKRILSESVEVIAKEGATHTAEFFSGSARAFAITVAHRSHVIKFVRVAGATEVEVLIPTGEGCLRTGGDTRGMRSDAHPTKRSA
jgi:hypothetical protein